LFIKKKFLLPSGQHIKKKKTATLFVQRFLLGFLFSRSLALLSLWDLLQICTYTANDSFSKHLQVRASFFSQWVVPIKRSEGMRQGWWNTFPGSKLAVHRSFLSLIDCASDQNPNKHVVAMQQVRY